MDKPRLVYLHRQVAHALQARREASQCRQVVIRLKGCMSTEEEKEGTDNNTEKEERVTEMERRLGTLFRLGKRPASEVTPSRLITRS